MLVGRVGLGVLAHLLQVSSHGFARFFCIPLFDSFKNALVMKLPALRAAINLKDPHPLFAGFVRAGLDYRARRP